MKTSAVAVPDEGDGKEVRGIQQSWRGDYGAFGRGASLFQDPGGGA